MITVRTPAGLWVVPPNQALWLAPGTRNDLEMAGPVSLRALYFKRRLVARRMPVECRMVSVSPLLRELLRQIIRLQTLDRAIPAQRNLLMVLLDQLALLPLASVDLPIPTDARAARAAKTLRESPADRRPLAAIARDTGASVRTLERLFHHETGLTLGAWRQRARLLRGMESMAKGHSVTRAGLDAGYDGTSAFISAFRRAFGTTPGRYFREAAVVGE
jgi:AraC-like DNA-binding protein